MRRSTWIALISLSAAACSSDFWRGCTSSVVGKTIETTKGVTTGVAEGIEEGRKAGQSVDGATLVSTMADFGDHGGVTVVAVGAGAAGSGSAVELAFENRGDTPLRVMAPQVTVLDRDGFVQRPVQGPPGDLTVPPRAKDRASWSFDVAPDRVGTVRLWDQDLPIPPSGGATP